MEIRTVAAVAKADAQTHEQLSESRAKLGIKNWKLIMSDDSDPDSIVNEHFRILGSNRSNRLENTAGSANKLRKQIIAELKSDANQPFVKGKPTVFMFEKRYDLNELGMMLVGNEMPKEQTGHWDFTTIDAYAAIVLNRGKHPEQIEAELTQQLTALHIAAKSPDVPRWFADGVGYSVAARLNKKNDIVKDWTVRAANVVDSMKEPFAFTNGKLNELDSGLAGFAYVKELKKSGDLTKLIRNLNQGFSFSNSFSAVLRPVA